MSTQITIRTFNGLILTYNVDDYEIKDGLIFFFDSVKKEMRAFPVANCEIRGVCK